MGTFLCSASSATRSPARLHGEVPSMKNSCPFVGMMSSCRFGRRTAVNGGAQRRASVTLARALEKSGISKQSRTAVTRVKTWRPDH